MWREGSRGGAILSGGGVALDLVLNPLVARRRARRALSADPVFAREIDLLVEAAHLAPSCFNNQPWRLVVIDAPDVLQAVKAAMPRGNYWTGARPGDHRRHLSPRPRLPPLRPEGLLPPLGAGWS